jgi:hypothetical protein
MGGITGYLSFSSFFQYHPALNQPTTNSSESTNQMQQLITGLLLVV